MKHVLLRTAAAVALLAAPTMAFARDQDRGDRQEMSRDANSGRMDASGSAESKLDDASKPRDGDRTDKMGRNDADSAAAQDVRGDRGKEDDSRRAEERRDRAAMDDPGERSVKDRGDRDDRARVSDERGGKDRDSRKDRADRDDASISDKVKISDKDGKDRRDKDRDGRRADRDRDRDNLDVKVKVSDRDRRGYDEDYGRSRTKTTVSSRDDVDVERRNARRASSDVDVEQRRSIRQRFASNDAGPRVARSTFEGSEVSVGASVPRTIAVRRVPATVIEAEPTYTTYSYFETDDERIVVVDPDSHRVVRVIED